MKTILRPLFIAAWFVFLTFPLVVMKVDTARGLVTWRWWNMLWVAVGAMALYPLWRYLLARKKGEIRSLSELIRDIPWLNTLSRILSAASGLSLLRKLYQAPEDGKGGNLLVSGKLRYVVPVFIIALAIGVAKFMGDWVHNAMLLSVFGLILVYVALPIFIRMLRGADQAKAPNPIFQDPKAALPAILAMCVFTLIFPFLFSLYQVKIMVLALTYIVLGLGLNIVVGLAGLLDLGYVAFYGVGAYTYGLLNHYYGLGFWTALPLGGFVAAMFGIILGFPVLRLRGDYLAIVTLGFGEIFRLVMENWGSFTQGPSGIKNIPAPIDPVKGGSIDNAFSFFGFESKMQQTAVIIYFIMLIMVVVTIFLVNRLQDSRIGRAWIALREDEIACQAMGIDKAKTKLTAFALGAMFAGFAGVLFASRERFVSPKSFEFIESALILSVVVLGGMGSIVGVVLGALIIILLPEYLRAFSDYRMLLFGAAMVLIMVFRPQGLVSNVRRRYQYKQNAQEDSK